MYVCWKILKNDVCYNMSMSIYIWSHTIPLIQFFNRTRMGSSEVRLCNLRFAAFDKKGVKKQEIMLYKHNRKACTTIDSSNDLEWPAFCLNTLRESIPRLFNGGRTPMTTHYAPDCSQVLPVKPQVAWARGIEAWAWSRDLGIWSFGGGGL